MPFLPTQWSLEAARSRSWRALPWAALLAFGMFALGCAQGCGGPSSAQGSGSAGPSAGAADAETDAAEDEEEPIVVRLAAVSLDSVSALYTTSATLRADKQATLTSRTDGVVKQLLVEEGDWVDGGQILAVLEDDEQTIEHEKASFVAGTKERELERAQNLHRQGLLSEEEFEVKRREAEEARQTAQMTELRLERTRVRASFSGRVTRRHLDVGNTVTNGTAFYDVADLDPLYADVNVPERHIAQLAAGQTVRLLADATAAAAPARIERLAPVVAPDTGTVKVTLAIDGVAKLRPGSFVRVEIVTDTHASTLVVPRSALVAEGRRWHLFRLTDDGRTVERLEVERGFEEGDRVEISLVAAASEEIGALIAGDRVVVVGASALTDGSIVRETEAEETVEQTATVEQERDAA